MVNFPWIILGQLETTVDPPKAPHLSGTIGSGRAGEGGETFTWDEGLDFEYLTELGI